MTVNEAVETAHIQRAFFKKKVYDIEISKEDWDRLASLHELYVRNGQKHATSIIDLRNMFRYWIANPGSSNEAIGFCERMLDTLSQDGDNPKTRLAGQRARRAPSKQEVFKYNSTELTKGN